MQKLSLKEINTIISKHKFLVFDKKVYELYFKKNDFKENTVFLLDEPESQKTLAGFEKLTNFLLSHSVSRDDCILAIGGGATTDLVGFVASCLLRGVSWKAIPTTLLSMIDASIGGKTGINSDYGKNLIGSFHLPQKTFICFNFLDTLNREELMSGKGELLKYCFLNKEIKEYVLKFGFSQDLIELCVNYKLRIVDQDLLESGARSLLNFGHTFGHAIEKINKLPHGTAVAVGIKWNLLLFEENLQQEFEELVLKLDITLPVMQRMDKDLFFDLISKDKKNSCEKIGQVAFIIKNSKKYISIEKLTELIENQDEINSLLS